MAQMIFVNLPVADVARSTAFYEAFGATTDPRFCQPGVSSMLKFSDEVVFMVMTPERFADFTSKRIINAKTEVQALLCLSGESREDIDAKIRRAVAAGAKADPTPSQQMGDYMYGRSFEDPDGHIIELAWMDVDKAMAAGGHSEAKPA